MDYNNLWCRDIITTAIKQLAMRDVKVVYDKKHIVASRLQRGLHIVFFNAIENEEERLRYEEIKGKPSINRFKTKSPTIHIPDLHVWELLDIFKRDETGAYERTCAYLNTIKMKGSCPIEIKYILNIFLHEIGHWEQMKRLNWDVIKFTAMDINLEEAHNNESMFLQQEMRKEISNIKLGEKPVISDGLMQKLVELEEGYRQIPKEADADNYARETLEKMDINRFMRQMSKTK